VIAVPCKTKESASSFATFCACIAKFAVGVGVIPFHFKFDTNRPQRSSVSTTLNNRSRGEIICIIYLVKW